MSIKKFVIAAAMLAAAGMAFAKTKIVTTIFPEYDWVREIAGDKAKDAEITLLINSGIDLHSYQPSVKDIAKISTAAAKSAMRSARRMQKMPPHTGQTLRLTQQSSTSLTLTLPPQCGTEAQRPCSSATASPSATLSMTTASSITQHSSDARRKARRALRPSCSLRTRWTSLA